MLLKTAMPFNLSSPEYLSHHRTRNNRVSPVSRASPAHMNSPLEAKLLQLKFGAENNWISDFQTLFSGANKMFDNQGNDITRLITSRSDMELE